MKKIKQRKFRRAIRPAKRKKPLSYRGVPVRRTRRRLDSKDNSSIYMVNWGPKNIAQIYPKRKGKKWRGLHTGVAPSSATVDTPTTPDKAMDLLDAAKKIVSGARRATYGLPEDNFRTIAAMWTPFLTKRNGRDVVITSADVAAMMILMKCARLGETINHADSTLDIAGYAACLARCQYTPEDE